MVRGIYTAAAGMLARLDQLDVAGNNLANVNTTGYKEDRLHFRALIGGQLNSANQTEVTGSEDMRVRMAQGSFAPTGNPLDLALDGSGFFVVQANGREYLTRNGHFTLNANGELVTSQGYNVLGESGPIVLARDEVRVNAKGEMVLDGAVATTLRLVDVADSAQLGKRGENLFEARAGAVVNPATATVRQGYLEDSNVNLLQRMVELVEVQHAFDTAQRAIHAEDETLRRTVVDLGKY